MVSSHLPTHSLGNLTSRLATNVVAVKSYLCTMCLHCTKFVKLIQSVHTLSSKLTVSFYLRKSEVCSKYFFQFKNVNLFGVFGYKTGRAGPTILKLSTKRIEVFKKTPRKRKFCGGSRSRWIVIFKINKRFPLFSKHRSQIFSNISYLKQFTPKKMWPEVLILPIS